MLLYIYHALTGVIVIVYVRTYIYHVCMNGIGKLVCDEEQRVDLWCLDWYNIACGTNIK